MTTSFSSSALPDRTLHELSLSEHPVALWKVKNGGTQHCEVENLMAGTTEVKLARCAPFRTSNHINDCTLDVDIPAQCIDPRRVWWNVRIHEREHNEHDSGGETEYDVHDAAELSVLFLIKLWRKSDNEAADACNCHERHVDWSVDYIYRWKNGKLAKYATVNTNEGPLMLFQTDRIDLPEIY